MIIAILGRQPALGVAELERVYGNKSVRWFSAESAKITEDDFDIEHFGGIQKAGHIVAELHGKSWRDASEALVRAYASAWNSVDHKITLGISAYGFNKTSSRDVQRTGILLKSKLKKSGVSIRLIPSAEPALNTAASHHNKLGLSNNKVELIVVMNKTGHIIIAESLGSQNITALARRDQGRPKRDAFVGMLPPKLARLMINLACGDQMRAGEPPLVLDPFCGTGVVLQESMLMGANAYGTDLSDKMIEFSESNLQWLQDSHKVSATFTVAQGDAMDYKWQLPFGAVVCETYLGQPFSAPPSPAKLREVTGNCNHIISSFLRNIHGQITPQTRLCVAVPAWKDAAGHFTHLPLTRDLKALGYEQIALDNVRSEELLYFRPDQVVARQLLILQKKP